MVNILTHSHNFSLIEKCSEALNNLAYVTEDKIMKFLSYLFPWSFEKDPRCTIVEAGGLDLCIEMITAAAAPRSSFSAFKSFHRTLQFLTGIVCSLAIVPEYRDLIRQKDGISPLVTLLTVSRIDKVKGNVAACMGNLSRSNEENALKIVALDAVPLLFDILVVYLFHFFFSLKQIDIFDYFLY